jgi:hypothetical protein
MNDLFLKLFPIFSEPGFEVKIHLVLKFNTDIVLLSAKVDKCLNYR